MRPGRGVSAPRHNDLEQEGGWIQRLERLHAGIMHCFCFSYHRYDVAELWPTQ